jgi:hypothetical protein
MSSWGHKRSLAGPATTALRQLTKAHHDILGK